MQQVLINQKNQQIIIIRAIIMEQIIIVMEQMINLIIQTIHLIKLIKLIFTFYFIKVEHSIFYFIKVKFLHLTLKYHLSYL